MERIRALLVGLSQVMMVFIIVIGTGGGFIVGGNSTLMIYGTFNIGLAVLGAIAGFGVSCVSMSVLAILLDIRLALLRIQARGII